MAVGEKNIRFCEVKIDLDLISEWLQRGFTIGGVQF